MEIKEPEYEEFINSELLQSIFPEPLFNYLSICGEKTQEVMEDIWWRNVEKNSRKLLKKHGFAKRKALKKDLSTVFSYHFFLGENKKTFSSTSCMKSLSPETM